MKRTGKAELAGNYFEWTPKRIASVKKIAEGGGTAREAAESVGLDPERDHLIYKLADRLGFRFKNIGRKRDDRSIFLRLDDLSSNVLTERAGKHRIKRRDLAAKLLNIVLQQGPIFIDNLLDDGE
jgi:hypothetical protein